MRFFAELGEQLDRNVVRRFALVVFGAAATLTLRVNSPLGWDEAVYAARAGDLSDTNFDWGTVTGGYWSDLRAPGFSTFVAAGFEIFGASDFVARLVSIAFSVGLLWMIAKTLDLVALPRAGTTAVIIGAVCPGFLATSTLAFADHTAAFFASVGFYFLLRAFVQGPGLGLVMVPLATGIATTARFGAAMFLGVAMALLAFALLYRIIRTKSYRDLIPFGISGLATAGIVLFLLSTTTLTRINSPIDATETQVDTVGNDPLNWLVDLQTILTPGAVDYGFNGPFWGWTYASLFVLLVLFAFGKLLVRGQWLWMISFLLVALAPVVFYGVSVRQYVTTYLSPQFAFAAGVLAWALWLPASGMKSEDEPPATSVPDPLPGSMGVIRIGLVAVALLAGFVGWRSFGGVLAMHERLTGFEQVRVAAIAADDILGADCRLVTSRIPQVAWYSDCVTVGFAGSLESEVAPAGAPWDDFLALQASRVDLSTSPGLGFLLLEGVGGQPRIDDVWSRSNPDNSVLLSAANGRRVAIVGLDVAPGVE